MYIDKYWGNFIGGSDDSLNLVAFLADRKKEEIPLSEIFAEIGLDRQNWDFRRTVEYLEFTHSNGVEMDFHFAIDVVTDLAAILLECCVSGSVDLRDLDEYDTPSRRIRVTATAEERDAMDKALADFVQDPLSYDLHDLMDDDEIREMAEQVEALRKELNMDLQQCRKWNEKEEGQKILDTSEAISYESFYDPGDNDYAVQMDDASWHLETIREKSLAVDELCACNHMAIYLRWCMEHDLMGEKFLAQYGEVVRKVKVDPASVDLRVFIRDELCGQLHGSLFNQEGWAFACCYYGEPDTPYFPRDIDNYAFDIIGLERNFSDEIQDEAYLFLPFDEETYQAIAGVIEERFENWQGQYFDKDTLEPSETARAIMEYLDCKCTYFPSMADDALIISAYGYARRDSAHEGFIPMLIMADDETLLECLVMNADPENDADCYEFDLKTVEEYRKKMLAAPVKDGKAVLEEVIGRRKEEAEDDGMDWEEDILGEMDGGYDNCRFSSYWTPGSDMTCPVILARIPVKNPWEVFACLPFGNWNECPDTPELMAAAKYWFEQYGAVPAVMSHDELEFDLPRPVSRERAMEAAAEQYGFCPDLDQSGDGSIGSLADVLWQSTVWYFWWD